MKLGKLDRNKSAGLDGISPYVLNECSASLCIPLALIFKKSFELGQVPAIWKQANITPIFKKGKKTIPGNYSPISLTSVVYKVMERLLRDEMMEHIKI